jgi:hypothetical protein
MLGTFPYFMAINGITKDYTCSARKVQMDFRLIFSPLKSESITGAV